MIEASDACFLFTFLTLLLWPVIQLMQRQ